MVPRNGSIGNVVTALSKKLSLDGSTRPPIRIYEAQAGKIHRELNEDVSVLGISEYGVLYAEKIPEEELNSSQQDQAIYCFHFDKEPTKPHSVPFKFVLKPGESMRDMRERLSQRTYIRGKLMDKVRLAIVSRVLYSKPRYLEEGKDSFPYFTSLSLG